jgi:hypothetical protein
VPADVRTQLARVVKREGSPRKAARVLEVNHATLRRSLGGHAVRAGTLAGLRAALLRLDDDKTNAAPASVGKG